MKLKPVEIFNIIFESFLCFLLAINIIFTLLTIQNDRLRESRMHMLDFGIS